MQSQHRIRFRPLLFFVVTFACAGCSTVGVHEQRLVSKPNMQFSRTFAYGYTSRIMPQLLPGLGVSGGAQPSVCTVCR
jgi:hypothetical protein